LETKAPGSSLQGIWMGFIDFLPNFLIALIVFLVGWIFAAVFEKGVTNIINAIKLDKLFESAGADKLLARAGLKLSVGGFLGSLVKWFILVVFLVTSLDIIGLSQVNDFLGDVVLRYLPQVFVAALVLVVATIVAGAARKIVSGSAKAANVHSSNMLGSIAYYAIWIFALIIALNQLGVAPQFMQILFTGIVVALALAFGLSFGLGGKEAASRWIDKVHNEMKG